MDPRDRPLVPLPQQMFYAMFLFAVAALVLPAEMPQVDGEWTRLAPVPEQRTEVSVTTDGERIYLIGGFARAGERGAVAPRPMLVYEPGKDAWSSPTEIPEGVNHAGFTYLDGRLYVVGGYRENSFDPTEAVHIYDLASQAWSRGAPLPTPRGALAAAVVDGKIHALGGRAGQASLATHEVYDPPTDTWTERAPMPTARDHHGAAVVHGRIHVPAGRSGRRDFRLTVNEIYDPESDSWREGAPLPTGRSGVAVVAHEGRVYVFGGETFGEDERTFDEAERYDAAADRWEVLPPMPTARHGLGAASVGDAIYVLSGGPRPGFSFGDANERLIPSD
jgi:N-acetylneuraminic acid mutarotase